MAKKLLFQTRVQERWYLDYSEVSGPACHGSPDTLHRPMNGEGRVGTSSVSVVTNHLSSSSQSHSCRYRRNRMKPRLLLFDSQRWTDGPPVGDLDTSAHRAAGISGARSGYRRSFYQRADQERSPTAHGTCKCSDFGLRGDQVPSFGLVLCTLTSPAQGRAQMI